MPVFLVFCHLSRYLVSGHILFYQVSPSRLWSASISLSIYCHLFYLSRGLISLSRLCTCPNHLNLFSLRYSAIGYMCASFQVSTFLTWSILVFALAHRNMRISVVCNFLSFLLTAQHSAPYTMASFIITFFHKPSRFIYFPSDVTVIYLIIRRCARTGAFPGAFCVPNSVALASPTLWGVQWAIH